MSIVSIKRQYLNANIFLRSVQAVLTLVRIPFWYVLCAAQWTAGVAVVLVVVLVVVGFRFVGQLFRANRW
jgi:hypothetical protein